VGFGPAPAVIILYCNPLGECDGWSGDSQETSEIVRQAREFGAKFRLTGFIDLAFIANDVSHIYQEAADSLDKFRELLHEDGEGDAREETEMDYKFV